MEVVEMEKDVIDALCEAAFAEPVEPPGGLSGRVLGAVYRAGKKRQRRIFALHSIAFALFLALAVWLGGDAVGEMSRSGFVHMLAMLWTDTGVALANASSWGLALVETLPLSEVAWSALALYFALHIGAGLVRRTRPRLPLGVI